MTSEPTVVDAATLDALTAEARRSPRLRMNRNLHAMDDPIHRLLNATEPGTYVAPHRHLASPRRETLSVVRGRGAVVVFGDAGDVRGIRVLAPGGPVLAIEIPPECWHTLVALEPGTVWFEVKAGPYVAPPPEDCATWAPAASQQDAAAAYLGRLEALVRAAPGGHG